MQNDKTVHNAFKTQTIYALQETPCINCDIATCYIILFPSNYHNHIIQVQSTVKFEIVRYVTAVNDG